MLQELTNKPAAVVPPEQVLWVGNHGFRLGTASPVDLSRKPVLSRLFQALVSTGLDPQRQSLHRLELIARVWPGQRFVGDSGRNRLNVALNALRRLGLAEAMEFDGHGHRFRTEIFVQFDR